MGAPKHPIQAAPELHRTGRPPTSPKLLGLEGASNPTRRKPMKKKTDTKAGGRDYMFGKIIEYEDE